MSKRIGYTPIENKTAIYESEAMLVQGVRNIILDLVGSNTGVFTVKIVGSISEEAPDFSQARSKTNRYDFIEAVDLQDGATLDGDVGVVFVGDDIRLLEANVNGLRWFGVIISAYTSGNVDCRVQGYSNDA